MPTQTDRNTFRFIQEYAEQNAGKAPSYALVADSVEGFEYIPEVSDSYEYLAKKVKGFSSKKQIAELFETKEGEQLSEFERKLNELDGQEFIEKWLTPALESIKMRTSVRKQVGTDIKTGADKFLEEYRERKLGKSFRIWRSKFSAIGQYVSSNVYTVYGKSGRGKSVITLEDAINAATQGARSEEHTSEL